MFRAKRAEEKTNKQDNFVHEPEQFNCVAKRGKGKRVMNQFRLF